MDRCPLCDKPLLKDQPTMSLDMGWTASPEPRQTVPVHAACSEAPEDELLCLWAPDLQPTVRLKVGDELPGRFHGERYTITRVTQINTAGNLPGDQRAVWGVRRQESDKGA